MEEHHNKFVLKITTNSEEMVKHIFLDCAEAMDKYGATLSPENEATKKLIEKNSE